MLSRHARQDVVVVGVEGHPVALACEKNDAFCERVEKARAALRLASLTLEDVIDATSTTQDATYHPVYQASIAATHEFGSDLLDLELVPTHSELGLRYRSDLFAERAAKRFLVQTIEPVEAGSEEATPAPSEEHEKSSAERMGAASGQQTTPYHWLMHGSPVVQLEASSQPLPSAPTSAISAEEEDELAALERSMAM